MRSRVFLCWVGVGERWDWCGVGGGRAVTVWRLSMARCPKATSDRRQARSKTRPRSLRRFRKGKMSPGRKRRTGTGPWAGVPRRRTAPRPGSATSWLAPALLTWPAGRAERTPAAAPPGVHGLDDWYASGPWVSSPTSATPSAQRSVTTSVAANSRLTESSSRLSARDHVLPSPLSPARPGTSMPSGAGRPARGVQASPHLPPRRGPALPGGLHGLDC
jgi:hypothetical protein